MVGEELSADQQFGGEITHYKVSQDIRINFRIILMVTACVYSYNFYANWQISLCNAGIWNKAEIEVEKLHFSLVTSL